MNFFARFGNDKRIPEKGKVLIPEWIREKYGRYSKQAYVCLTRRGTSLSGSWDNLKKKERALNDLKMRKYGTQLKLDL